MHIILFQFPAVSFLFNHPSVLTLRFLEAVAPLVVRQLAVLEGVTGVEEGLHAQLVLVQVDGTQL